MEQKQSRLKKGIQLAMTLAVCIWLLHQIQESSTHPIKEHENFLFGRKWKVGLADGGDPESENGNGLRMVEGNEDGYDQRELEGGIHGFRDENGIPEDGFELVNSIPYEGKRQYDQRQEFSDYYR